MVTSVALVLFSLFSAGLSQYDSYSTTAGIIIPVVILILVSLGSLILGFVLGILKASSKLVVVCCVIGCFCMFFPGILIVIGYGIGTCIRGCREVAEVSTDVSDAAVAKEQMVRKSDSVHRMSRKNSGLNSVPTTVVAAPAPSPVIQVPAPAASNIAYVVGPNGQLQPVLLSSIPQAVAAPQVFAAPPQVVPQVFAAPNVGSLGSFNAVGSLGSFDLLPPVNPEFEFAPAVAPSGPPQVMGPEKGASAPDYF